MVTALNSQQISTSKSISKTLYLISQILPPLPHGVSPLSILERFNLINSKKSNDTPTLNMDTSSKMVSDLMRGTNHFYDFLHEGKRQDEDKDREEREEESKKKPLDRWKAIEAKLQSLLEKKQLFGSQWEIQCKYTILYFIYFKKKYQHLQIVTAKFRCVFCPTFIFFMFQMIVNITWSVIMRRSGLVILLEKTKKLVPQQ